MSNCMKCIGVVMCTVFLFYVARPNLCYILVVICSNHGGRGLMSQDSGTWPTDVVSRIIELIDKSLEKKWHKKSNRLIREECPFCTDVVVRNQHTFYAECCFCLCPDSICSLWQEVDAINKIQKEHISTFNGLKVSDLSDDELESVIHEFKAWRKRLVEVDR